MYTLVYDRPQHLKSFERLGKSSVYQLLWKDSKACQSHDYHLENIETDILNLSNFPKREEYSLPVPWFIKGLPLEAVQEWCLSQHLQLKMINIAELCSA